MAKTRLDKCEIKVDGNRIRINTLYWVFGVVVLSDLIARIIMR